MLCHSLLATVFAASALAKLRPGALRAFAASLEGYGLPPTVSMASVAVVAEIGAAALLVAGRPEGLVVSAALLAGFTALTAHVLWRGGSAECHCFGGGSTVGRGHLVRNGLLLAVVGFGIAHPPGWALGVALGLGFTRWDDLLFLALPPPTRGVT